LIASFDDYEFFEGVNMEHPSMKGNKGYDICSYHESTIWFAATILSGEYHKFDLFVIPTNYWENQISHTIKLYKDREVMNREDKIRREKWEKSFKYLQEQASAIDKMPENFKNRKDYLRWLDETLSKISDEWKDTQEYSKLLEELEHRKNRSKDNS
jgi:hypothetical protein